MEDSSRYKDPAARKEYKRKYQRSYMQRYRADCKENGKKYNEHRRDYWNRIRNAAVEKIGGFRCANCGCEIKKILEVNHIDGGGRQELRTKNRAQLYRDIVNGKVDISKYNMLCKVCNGLHYVEMILGIKGHKVIWDASLV